MSYVETPNIYQTNTCIIWQPSYDGADVKSMSNGSLVAGPTNVGGPMRWVSAGSGITPKGSPSGRLDPGYNLWIDGVIDEGATGIRADRGGDKKAGGRTKASEPQPADGAMHAEYVGESCLVPGVRGRVRVTHDYIW